MSIIQRGLLVLVLLSCAGVVTVYDCCRLQADVPSRAIMPAPRAYYQAIASPQRGFISLNGQWDWKAIGGRPYSLKNTTLFAKPDSPLPAVQTKVKLPTDGWTGKMLLPHQAANGEKGNAAKCWYRREFTVPVEWKSRQIEIQFMGAGFEVAVWVNGQLCGTHLGDATAFAVDITKAVKTGQKNEVHLRVWRHEIAYGEIWPQIMMEGVHTPRQGVWDDICLRSRPKIAVEKVFCKTSFRNQQMDAAYRLVNDTVTPAKITLEAVVLDKDGKISVDLGRRKFTIRAGRKLGCVLPGRWRNPHLWMPDDPYLYIVETKVKQNGKLIDTHRERFGFAECWIDGGDFRINGKVVRFHQQSLAFGRGQHHLQDVPGIRTALRKYKKMGVNMLCLVQKPSSMFLEIADEEGMFIKVQSGWHHPTKSLTPEFKKNTSRVIQEWIERDRNHPSVAMWCAGNEPVGGCDTILWAKSVIERFDSIRPIDIHRSFGNSPYITDGSVKKRTHYEIANLDYPIVSGSSYSLLSAAEFPSRWAIDRPLPLFVGRWGGLFTSGMASLGPKHYEKMFAMKGPKQSGEFGYEGVLEYLRSIIPHWRRARVSGAGDQMISLEHKSELTKKHDNVDHEYAKLWAPKFAYFVDRTRAVYAGSQFKRTLCVVNETMDDLKTGVTVKMTVNGKTQTVADMKLKIAQGQVVDVPVSFKLPAVKKKTPARITIEFEGSKKGSHTIGLDLDIFPPRIAAAKSKTKIGLYDPAGMTGAAMKKLGLAFKPVADIKKLKGLDVLVIGRHGLDKTVVAARDEILAFVKAGGKVVCSGQKAWLSWLPLSLRMDRGVEMPQAWRMASNSLLFAGLNDVDLSWWPNNRGKEASYKVPGAVAVNCYQKPTVGRVRPLLENGVRLALSPLLEFRHGKGVVLLSQLELEPVVGVSPVADIVFERLVQAPVTKLPTRRVWYAGDAAAKGFVAGQMGVEITDLASGDEHEWSEKDLILWMPHGRVLDGSQSKSVKKATDAGASLLVICNEAKFLPKIAGMPAFDNAESWKDRPFVYEKKIRMAIVKRGQPLVDGVSNSELTERTLARWQVVEGKEWKHLASPGVIAMRKNGKSVQVVSTMLRWGDGKVVGNYGKVLHKLLTNLGAVSLDHRASGLAGSGKFLQIDLRKHCTMGFSDERDGDGKGGWTDQGKTNDLGIMPTGRLECVGVPFDVIDPSTNAGKSAVVLGGGTRLGNKPTSANKIDFGHRKVKKVYFLHSAAWLGRKLVGEYRVHYTKALEMHETIPLIGWSNIGDWWNPRGLPKARIGWRSRNELANVGLYVFEWTNPHPDTAIDTIDFVSFSRGGKGTIMCLVAITAEE